MLYEVIPQRLQCNTMKGIENSVNVNISMSSVSSRLLSSWIKRVPFCFQDYSIDEEGKLVQQQSEQKKSGTEIQLQDSATCQKLLSAITSYVHTIMTTQLDFIRVSFPHLADSNLLSGTLFATKNYMACEKLLVLVTSGRGVEPGIWSRSLVLKQGLRVGSMLPYFQKALDDGYGILVTNPSTALNRKFQSSSDTTERTKAACNPATSEQLIERVWDHIIMASPANRVYFIGYAYGGVLVKHILNHRSKDFLRRNGAVALIESSHRVDDSDSVECKSILAHRSMYWQASDLPCQTRLEGDAPKRTGCICLSAGPGLRLHNMSPRTTTATTTGSTNAANTIASVLEAVYRFLNVRDSTMYAQEECALSRKSQQRWRATEVHQPPLNKSPTLLAKTALTTTDAGKSPSTSSTLSASKKQCMRCGFFFTLFDRRHHCRLCLSPVCNTCSRDRLFLPGCSRAQRVCTCCASDGFARKAHICVRRKEKICKKKCRDKLSMDDFDLLKVIGKGAFGKVMLVRKRDDGEGAIYALKVLKKHSIFSKNQVEHTKSERRILRDIKHPFVVRLRYAFQTEDKLYLVMDYYNGGSLFYHLRRVRRFTEERARFYSAQLLLALEHLHGYNILYRDLKLENILMDNQGYIALTDFGLSKENVDVPDCAKTFCGTAEYIAPELLKGSSYGKAVDWWGFGTLLYEMMAGQTPFFDRNRKQMFQNILRKELTFPLAFSEDVKSLLSGLLRKDPTKRLGSGPGGVSEIMDHPFFCSIDFKRLENKEMKAPFIPVVRGDADTTNVANVFTREIPVDSPVRQQMDATLQANAHFDGFTYVPSSDLTLEGS